ncbi:GyrI-like domain-containing protein [Dyadobacter fermentans]|uniref:GyrI-like domain-containing protein n=1 Tax=Dyadobacter fermentans TaxID=94254 RepID=UPI001CBB6E5E|nr:GyrI-like domain-containing protein [Dyadobacter fermentans]MBZ1358050.1 GyrI-like domain-containing protein [Dyadobacter fermentans]
MEKLDLTKHFKSYYTAKTKPEVLHIEKARYLSITGKGDPSGEDFAQKIQAIYPVAYALKFAFKAQGKDFVVAKLEGLWWYDEVRYAGISIADSPTAIPRSEWEYRLLIRIPDYVEKKDVEATVEASFASKNQAAIREVSYFEMNEGKVVQMLHTGPFDNEPETLAKLNDFISAHALGRNGLHHEIYLSDFRKTPPHKLKTILREPVK